MADKTKYALSRPRIPQVFDLPLTVPATETIGTKGLIASKNS
jgi:hypothetical protein